jgi:hypothetical protein
MDHISERSAEFGVPIHRIFVESNGMDSFDKPNTFGSILVALYVSFIFSTES